MAHLLDLSKNLCSSCTMDISYCPADSEDVDYGSGTDNIVSCPFYDGNPNMDGASEVIEDMPKAETN